MYFFHSVFINDTRVDTIDFVIYNKQKLFLDFEPDNPIKLQNKWRRKLNLTNLANICGEEIA